MQGAHGRFRSQLPIGLARQVQGARGIDPLEGLDRVLVPRDALEQRTGQVLAAEIALADGLGCFKQSHAVELCWSHEIPPV